jgi:hypothetical protein
MRLYYWFLSHAKNFRFLTTILTLQNKLLFSYKSMNSKLNYLFINYLHIQVRHCRFYSYARIFTVLTSRYFIFLEIFGIGISSRIFIALSGRHLWYQRNEGNSPVPFE